MRIKETLKPLFSIRGRFRHMSKEYTIESTTLVLRGIKFSDYRLRLNPNKQNGGKVVSAIPCLTLRFLYCGDDPQEWRPFQGIPGHAFEIYYSNPDVSISGPVTFAF